MKTALQARNAESATALLLCKQGYEILARNWKTRVCEIDIVAKKDKVVYFIEVKYRSNPLQGSGFDYITPRKRQQIEFSAKIWNQQNDWSDDCRLLAAAVAGTSYQDIAIVEIF